MIQQISGTLKYVAIVLTTENNTDVTVICDQGSLQQLATFRIGEHAQCTGRLETTFDGKLTMAVTAVTRK
jgi:hypothetical protein